jgi:hypothetical protein
LARGKKQTKANLTKPCHFWRILFLDVGREILYNRSKPWQAQGYKEKEVEFCKREEISQKRHLYF